MKEFEIKIHLFDQTDLILTNYSNFIWDEFLEEEENDRKTLRFNVSPQKTDLFEYIKIGKILHLKLKERDSNIDFIITDISPIENNDSSLDYFEVTAEDYASFVFSRNSVGMNINTMEDEDFNNWLDERELDGEVGDLLQYILIKSNLYNEELNSGWTIKDYWKYSTPISFNIEDGVWTFSIDTDNEYVEETFKREENIYLQALVYAKGGKTKSRQSNSNRQLSRSIYAPHQLWTGEIFNEEKVFVPGRVLLSDKIETGLESLDLSNWAHDFISYLNRRTDREVGKLYSNNFNSRGYFFLQVSFVLVTESNNFILRTQSDWLNVHYTEHNKTNLKKNYNLEKINTPTKRSSYYISTEVDS